MVAEIKTATYSDLREWLDLVAAFQELRLVLGADWNLEIGALTELMPRRSDTPPALLFDQIKDYLPGYRLLTNSLSSPKRLALTFGLPEDLRGVELVDAWRQRLHTLQMTPPRVVERGPVQQNVRTGTNVDLTRLPAPLWHEDDGGRYLGTGCIAITRDPDSGWVNAGT